MRYSRNIGYDMAHVRPSLELFFGEHAEWRVWPNDEYAPFTERGGRSTFRVMQLTVNPRFSVQQATERGTRGNGSVLSGTVLVTEAFFGVLRTHGGLCCYVAIVILAQPQPTTPQERGDETHHQPAKDLTRPSFAYIRERPLPSSRMTATSRSQIQRPTRSAGWSVVHGVRRQRLDGRTSD